MLVYMVYVATDNADVLVTFIQKSGSGKISLIFKPKSAFNVKDSKFKKKKQEKKRKHIYVNFILARINEPYVEFHK